MNDSFHTFVAAWVDFMVLKPGPNWEVRPGKIKEKYDCKNPNLSSHSL